MGWVEKMIESYLQITCDGCGVVEPDSVPYTTYKVFRQEMRKYGWRNYGKLDYCSICVANSKATDHYSIFEKDCIT